MTIRLLAAYGIYPCNAIVTLDSATEAGLIAAKQALADTTGGTPYVAPVLPEAIDETKSGSAGTDSNGNVLTPVLASHNLVTGVFTYSSPINPDYPTIPLSARPVITSFGDSINSHDLTFDLFGTMPAVSPMFWTNALSCNAFDFIDCSKTTTITPTAGTQTTGVTYRNGACGRSGGLMTDGVRYGIDQFIAQLAIDAPSRQCYIILSGAINDLASAAADSAGYAATIWTSYLEVINKIVAAGHVPLLKAGESSTSISTQNKRRNQAALYDRVMSYAAANDLPVLDCAAAIRKHANGASMLWLSRGVTGDRIHPNGLLAQIYGIEYAEAIKNRVAIIPKFARSDFTGSILTTNPWLLGTAGTKGANADALSEVPDSWTLAAQTNTVAKTTNAEYDIGGSGTFVEITTPGTPTAGATGLTSAAPFDANVSRLHQSFVDLTVIQADYTDVRFLQRRDGGNFTLVPQILAADTRVQTADYPGAGNMLAGRRVVLSSVPAAMPASTQGSLHAVGGGNGLESSSGRTRSHVRFAGFVQYSDPAAGYVP